jgi:hypothetical protein
MLTKFPKLIKDILKPLPRNDHPALNTFLFVSCWIGFALGLFWIHGKRCIMRYTI